MAGMGACDVTPGFEKWEHSRSGSGADSELQTIATATAIVASESSWQ